MRPLRPELADGHSQIRRDLALTVQVIGLDIGILEISIDRGWGQSGGGGVAQRAAEGGSQARIGRRRRKPSWGGYRRVRRRAGNQVRHRLIGEYCIASADRGLSIFERIPREPDTWLDGMIVLVNLINTRPDALQRIGRRVEDDQAIVALARRHEPVITQAQFEGDVRLQLEAVLREAAERLLDDAARLAT